MHTTLRATLAASALAGLLAAQSPAFVTSTDFGVLARTATQSGFDSIDANTPVQRGIAVRAAASERGSGAQANTTVTGLQLANGARGVQVQETGAAFSDQANGAAACGTSASNQNDPAPRRGAHGIRLHFPLTANATGTVYVHWRGSASTGAAAGVSIDIDGDGVADFSARANGTALSQQLPVTAGRNGITIDITTLGRADVTGVGRERYEASLAVAFAPTPQPPTCTFTAFGPQCDGALAGSLQTTPRGEAIQLDVTGATAGAIGVLVIGPLARTPQPLPGSTCDLLLQPAHSQLFRLDANGDGQQMIPLPRRMPIDINFQVVTIITVGNARVRGSTNGVNLLCQ